jgi:acyl carrier protein
MEIEKTIEQFIAEEILHSKDPIDHQESLFTTGILDSLGLLRLIAFLAEHFEVQVADEDVAPENFDSINQIASYVADRK